MQDCPDGQLTPDKFLELNRLFFPASFCAEKFCEYFFATFNTNVNGYFNFKEYLLAINMMNSETPEDKLKVAFRIFDLDGNGEISFGEMNNLIASIFKMPLVDDTTRNNAVIESAKHIFLKMDKNEYGYLTEEEFVASCLQDDLLLKNRPESRHQHYLRCRVRKMEESKTMSFKSRITVRQSIRLKKRPKETGSDEKISKNVDFSLYGIRATTQTYI